MQTFQSNEVMAESENLKRTYRQVKKYEETLQKKHESHLTAIEEARGRGTEARDDLLHSRSMARRIEEDINHVRRALKEIYFGEIAYKSPEKNCSNVFYITNHRCLVNPDLRDLNIIHRFAPQAEMYYSHQGRYFANKKVNNVELSLVRYLNVEEDRLNSMYDLLKVGGEPEPMSLAIQEQLEKTGESRLEGTYRTLDHDQYLSIKGDLHKNMIIRGGAGAGKTIAILNRVAYVLYENVCEPTEILIITPQERLLNPMDRILGDIEVENVERKSLKEWAKSVINYLPDYGRSIPLEYPVDARAGLKLLADWKDSEWMKEYLRSDYIAVCDMLAHALPDFVYCTSRMKVPIILNSDRIAGWFMGQIRRGEPYSTVIEKLGEWLKSALIIEAFNKLQKKEVSEKDYGLDDLVRPSNPGRAASRQDNDLEMAIIGKEGESIIDDYCDSCFPPQLQLFKALERRYYSLVELQNRVLRRRYKSLIEIPMNQNDAANVFYLYLLINGAEPKYHHIFVDEAQNLPVRWLECIRQFLKPGGVMTVSGDINQAIFFDALNSWDPVIKLLDEPITKDLDITYRSTTGVVKAARWAMAKTSPLHTTAIGDSIREKKDDFKMVSVLKGHEVKSLHITIAECLTAYPNGRIGVLVPSAEWLQRTGFSELRSDRVDVMPIYESTGLEWDVVIVVGADELDRTRLEEARALYTAFTRASHKLYVINIRAESGDGI